MGGGLAWEGPQWLGGGKGCLRIAPSQQLLIAVEGNCPCQPLIICLPMSDAPPMWIVINPPGQIF